MPEIFVSYRREDSAGHVGWLYTELVDAFGSEHVFRDLDSIRPGDPFPDVLRESLTRADVMLVVIGADWFTGENRRRLHDPGDYVRQEIATALSRPDVRVVPVLVHGGQLPTAADLPDDLATLPQRQAIELRDDRWKDDVAHLERVLRAGRRRWSWRWALAASVAVIAAGVIASVTLGPGPATGPDDRPSPTGTAAPTPSPTTDQTPSPTPPRDNTPEGSRWRINFQERGAPLPDGYLVDFGQPFGEQPSGLRYGWVEPGTNDAKDMTAHARDRNESEDQLLDTLMHFRNFNPGTGDTDFASWEFAAEPGTYLVKVSVGEPAQLNGQRNNVVVEGKPAITEFVSAESNVRHESNTVTVDVQDGRLTLDSVDAGTTKINFVEIERLG